MSLEKAGMTFNYTQEEKPKKTKEGETPKKTKPKVKQ